MWMIKLYTNNRNYLKFIEVTQTILNYLLAKYCMMQCNTSIANKNITAYELNKIV